MGMPDINAMKQGNVAFVCRYVGWSDLSQAKILTPQEAQTLSQNGIAIVSNYEWYGSRPQEGAAAADVDAARALQIHKACGGPDNAPIYFSVDYNSPGSDVAEYFKELANQIGIERVGAYGGYACIKYLFDNGLITWGWQTYAWSNGQWDSRAQIRQTQNAVQFGGIEVDFDTGMVANVGQWAVGEQPVIFNSHGLVMDIDQTNQLFENEMDLCGPWSVAALLYANIANRGVLGTGEQIDQWTDAAVAAMGWTPANFPGVSVSDMEWLLKRAGLNYWEIPTDWGSIQAAINAGYPVIVTAYEPNMLAWSFSQNAWVHPYPWSANANHVLPVGGFDHNGNPVCADQLNNSFQGYWPPIYNRFPVSYAVVVRIHGLAPIPSGTPLTWPAGFNAQLGGTGMPVPQGWKDDGSKLTSPSGHYAVFGMRNFILNSSNWDASDYLLEEEHAENQIEESNTTLGPGSVQVTRYHRLEYQKSSNRVFPGYFGQEYLFVKADRDSKAAALASANAQITQLQAQIQQLEQQAQSGPTNLADIKAKLDKMAADTAAAAQVAAQELSAVESELSSDLPH